MLFWGYLFVFIDFSVGIDLMADSIGYLMMVNGLSNLPLNSPYVRRAKGVAIMLALVAIPQIMSFQTTSLASGVHIDFWWGMYSHIISLLDITLVFFIFKCLLEIIRHKDYLPLHLQTQHRFKGIISIKLVYLFVTPFLMNIPEDLALPIGISALLSIIIADLFFLGLLRKYHKEMPGNEHPVSL